MEDHSWVDFALTFLKVRITHTTFFSFILFAVFFFFKQNNGIIGKTTTQD